MNRGKEGMIIEFHKIVRLPNYDILHLHREGFHTLPCLPQVGWNIVFSESDSGSERIAIEGIDLLPNAGILRIWAHSESWIGYDSLAIRENVQFLKKCCWVPLSGNWPNVDG
jgi:hypothetical protein